ncbi:MAG TPA: PDZ domain-containing protein [Pyrinomonadaceae bacterium]
MHKEQPVEAGQIKSLVQAASPEIAYTVSMSKPWTHLLEVQMHVHWNQMPARLELKMPVWTPGSYLIREYARNVQDFDIKAGGKDLVWQKINKNTWQIDTAGAKDLVASYRVYANELTVRTNELNDEHAFWNNAGTLMFPKDQLRAPSTVTVNPYIAKWKIATGLPKVADQANTFRAANYDILYDSPFEVSDFKEVDFTVEGKPHRIVFSGDGNYDMQKTAADVAKIVDEAYKIFGEFGYDNYTFIVNLRGGGGLEHLNSTALQYDRFGFKPESRYKNFLALAAHEYFHNFNVKRIRPDALGPFDYENENYTRMLWVAEGGTEYYANLLLRRAGFLTDKEYLEEKAGAISALQRTPGRLETSLEDASFDAWIKYYRQDENSVNNQISYYDKGEIVNMLLDVTIRESSGGKKSLDDVMRYLWNEYFKKGRNYGPQDYQKAAELMAGRGLDDFFSKYVRGVAEIDYNAIFNPIGLELKSEEPDAGMAYIGANLVEDNGRLTVRSVPAGSPAYDQGINAGDQIVAIDGYRASQARLQQYLADRKPGDKVRLSIFRTDRLRDIDLTLGNNTRQTFSFAPVASPTEQQRRLYREWMKNDL